MQNKSVLITTYTNENLEQINGFIIKRNGFVPKNVTILSWFSFLLQEGVRPYQSCMTERNRINGIIFDNTIKKGVRKDDVDNYFLTKGDNIYRDRVSDFVCQCDNRTEGLVMERLTKIYANIFIDEVQDFAGYDLDFLEKIFKSSIDIIAVGDPRQSTYSTNNASKNKQYKRHKILEWITKKEEAGLCSVEGRVDCYRCNQQICDYADALFPQLSKTKSNNNEITGHDGVFSVKPKETLAYIEKYKPTILRWNKKANTMGQGAINIGVSKGRTYDRVLIFPTKPMTQYLKTGDTSKAGDLSKLYVAVTRAKYSVAFVWE